MKHCMVGADNRHLRNSIYGTRNRKLAWQTDSLVLCSKGRQAGRPNYAISLHAGGSNTAIRKTRL